jgi:hypothetical protein
MRNQRSPRVFSTVKRAVDPPAHADKAKEIRSLSLRDSPHTMFRTAFIMGLIGAASAFAPGAMLPKTKGIRPATSISPRMQLQGTPLIKSTRLTPQLFNELDKDKSGTIELEELKAVRLLCMAFSFSIYLCTYTRSLVCDMRCGQEYSIDGFRTSYSYLRMCAAGRRLLQER